MARFSGFSGRFERAAEWRSMALKARRVRARTLLSRESRSGRQTGLRE
jgi:hypothetical protein